MTISLILKKYSENFIPYFPPQYDRTSFLQNNLTRLHSVVNCVYILALSIRQHGGQVDWPSDNAFLDCYAIVFAFCVYKQRTMTTLHASLPHVIFSLMVIDWTNYSTPFCILFALSPKKIGNTHYCLPWE